MADDFKKSLHGNLIASLRFAVSDEAAVGMAEVLCDDVADELDRSYGEDFTSDDVRSATGRVLMSRLRH